MLYYFAPLEGITNSVYHNAYHQFFKPLNKSFTPFFIPNEEKGLSKKDQAELRNYKTNSLIVPQLLTNHSDSFIKASETLKDLDYSEVNLNLGCPSGTVVSKRRGSGFLSQLDALESFLEDIFSNTSLKISLKTRLGLRDPDEFSNIMLLFEKYPLHELIIHPRVREDYYSGKPHMDVFSNCLDNAKFPIIYSGDLFSAAQIKHFQQTYAKTQGLMLGRGIIANPGLFEHAALNKPITSTLFQDFHNYLYEQYQSILFGPKPVLFKMKELCFYMLHMFENHEKHAKRIRKTQNLSDYDNAIKSVFRDLTFNPNNAFHPKLKN